LALALQMLLAQMDQIRFFQPLHHLAAAEVVVTWETQTTEQAVDQAEVQLLTQTLPQQVFLVKDLMAD
jgi:hypothetical protein